MHGLTGIKRAATVWVFFIIIIIIDISIIISQLNVWL